MNENIDVHASCGALSPAAGGKIRAKKNRCWCFSFGAKSTNDDFHEALKWITSKRYKLLWHCGKTLLSIHGFVPVFRPWKFDDTLLTTPSMADEKAIKFSPAVAVRCSFKAELLGEETLCCIPSLKWVSYFSCIPASKYVRLQPMCCRAKGWLQLLGFYWYHLVLSQKEKSWEQPKSPHALCCKGLHQTDFHFCSRFLWLGWSLNGNTVGFQSWLAVLTLEKSLKSIAQQGTQKKGSDRLEWLLGS